MTLSTARKATKAEAGRLGARKRWDGHVPRVIRMDSLRPEEADVVRALLRLKAARDADNTKMTAGTGETFPAVESEVRDAAATTD